MNNDYERLSEAISGRRLPLAFVDLDAFDQNLSDLAARAKTKPIRVPSKSLRCRALIDRALAHPQYRGVMCFTPEEAAFLASNGIDDLLVAYPCTDLHQLRATLSEIRAGRSIVFTIDDARHLRLLRRVAEDAQQQLQVCLDLDMASRIFGGLHFGVRRSPIRTAPQAIDLARSIRVEPHLELVGVLAYEAQLAGLPDNPSDGSYSLASALFHGTIRTLKSRSAKDVRQRRGTIITALRQAGHALRFVNGGGTGSLESTAEDPAVTEVSAGSGLFAPALFDHFRRFRHHPAAGFALPAVRQPTRHIVTCLGGGYIASGSAGEDRLPIPWLPPQARLVREEGAGEVQTPVRLHRPIKLGQPVFFRHAKAGELLERFNTVCLIQGDKVVDEVPTYRGEGQCFL